MKAAPKLSVEPLDPLARYDWVRLDDAAELWAAAGFHPIELYGLDGQGSCACGRPERHPDGRGAGKHPVEAGWHAAELGLPALLERFRHNETPRNLGLRMGLQPGGERLLAVDDDGGLEAFEAKRGALPPTLTLASGGGGRHRLYRVPLDVPFRNRVKVDGFDLDLRCDGGQIVVAPSSHASGARYSIAELRPVADLPSRFVELLRDKPPPSPTQPPPAALSLSVTLGALANQAARALAYCQAKAKADPSIQGSDGSAALARWAGAIFWRLGLNEAEGLPLLREMNSIGATPPWSEAELRHAMRSGLGPHPSRPEQRGHLLAEWAAADELQAQRRGGPRAPAETTDDWIDEMNEPPATEAESDEPSGIHEAPASNVTAGPWPRSSPAEQWRLPEERVLGNVITPNVSVPEPESWAASDEEALDVPEVPAANMKDLRDVTSLGIATRLLEQIDEFHEAFVFDAGQYWLYGDGIYRRLPNWWVKSALQAYHGAQSIQQQLGQTEIRPWFSNAGALASAEHNLRLLLEKRQASPDGRSFFSGTDTLAVFGSQTLTWPRGEDRCRLQLNDPGFRATFAYPFEYSSDVVEPAHLLRIMREDMFRGVEPEEAELRIERIRQQMGLALLGAQRMANLHNVLIMLGQGHDGKSMLLGLLQACMPPGSWAAMHPQDLCSGIGDGAEGRAELHGRYAVICEDVSSRAMKDSSNYKVATAYGALRGRHFGSGVSSFQVDVRATWLLSCQELWDTSDKTHGFARRHCIIEFPNSVRASDADRRLRDKLLALEKREFVLWCVHAALELLAGGELAKPACSDQLMRAWLLGGNDVASFLEANTEDCSTEPVEEWPPVEELWGTYKAWVSWLGAKPVSLIEFGRKAKQVRGVTTQRGGTRETRATRICRRRAMQTTGARQ